MIYAPCGFQPAGTLFALMDEFFSPIELSCNFRARLSTMAELLKLSELSKATNLPLRRLRFWARSRLFPTYKPDHVLLVDPAEFAQWLASTRIESKDHANKED